jgi:hypothetical protein
MSMATVRRALWEREGGKCWYCGRDTMLNAGEQNPRLATVDHLIPRARGGVNNDTNRVNCCLRCNQLKGTLTEAEFRSMSSVEAVIFNDAASRYGIKNIDITEVALAAGPGYRKTAAAERLQAAGYFSVRTP